MSKHNYSQYSNKPKNESHKQPNVEKPAVVEEAKLPEVATTPKVKMEPVAPAAPIEPVINLVQETVETVTIPETVAGTVANCAKLNVRATPSTNAEIVCVLDVMSEIQIDVEKSNNEWFKIFTATGIDGYCMRKFVNAHL